MSNDQENLARAKQELRQRLKAVRQSLDPEWVLQASQAIQETLVQLPEYQSSRSIMSYVSTGKEVETHRLLLRMKRESKVVVIPWCEGDELRLFRWESFDELDRGTLNILEPRPDLRSKETKIFSPHELDLVLVPGLAFDRNGNRLGRGRGYYDRFLKTLPRRVVRIGLAFECQLVERVPVSPNDEKVDLILTEFRTYRVPRVD